MPGQIFLRRLTASRSPRDVFETTKHACSMIVRSVAIGIGLYQHNQSPSLLHRYMCSPRHTVMSGRVYFGYRDPRV